MGGGWVGGGFQSGARNSSANMEKLETHKRPTATSKFKFHGLKNAFKVQTPRAYKRDKLESEFDVPRKLGRRQNLYIRAFFQREPVLLTVRPGEV